MNKRTKTLWVPGLISLTGSMAWRLILQRTILPSQTLLNHSGLPVVHQVLWLAALPLFGAASAYLSRRAGGDRLAAVISALFPSIVMIPLWVVLAIRMRYPSPAQWFGFFSGVLNWIVVPSAVLLLGAVPFFKGQPAIDWKPRMNSRTKTFWLPSLVSLTAAMTFLTISTFVGLQPRFVAHGSATLMVYVPWLLMLPLCGAAGAYLSHRTGGKRLACLAAGVFPVIALASLVGFLTLTGKFVYAKPQRLYFLLAVLLAAILPGVALVLGALPFIKASQLQKPLGEHC